MPRLPPSGRGAWAPAVPPRGEDACSCSADRWPCRLHPGPAGKRPARLSQSPDLPTQQPWMSGELGCRSLKHKTHLGKQGPRNTPGTCSWVSMARDKAILVEGERVRADRADQEVGGSECPRGGCPASPGPEEPGCGLQSQACGRRPRHPALVGQGVDRSPRQAGGPFLREGGGQIAQLPAGPGDAGVPGFCLAPCQGCLAPQS